MGRMLITGGAGFIGSSLAKIALEMGWKVTILDNLSSSSDTTLVQLENLGIEVIIGDIRDQNILKNSLLGVTAVVHLAAQVSVPMSVINPEETMDINVKGTQNVIQACLENNVQRLVMASSAAVYGEGGQLPLKEEYSGKYLSPYADSKLANEQQILNARMHGLDATALRLFNVYGVEQRADGAYAAVIPKFVDMMAKGVAPKINGDGLQTRDFIHVSDVNDAIMTLVNSAHGSIEYHVYNVATQTKISLLELVREINDILSELVPDFKPLVPTHGPERTGDIRHSLASINRISSALDWKPSKDFKQGIQEIVIYRMKSM